MLPRTKKIDTNSSTHIYFNSILFLFYLSVYLGHLILSVRDLQFERLVLRWAHALIQLALNTTYILIIISRARHIKNSRLVTRIIILQIYHATNFKCPALCQSLDGAFFSPYHPTLSRSSYSSLFISACKMFSRKDAPIKNSMLWGTSEGITSKGVL